MTRQEAATVMDRLLALTSGGSTVTPGTDPEKPTDATYALEVQTNTEIGNVVVVGEKIMVSCRALPYEAAPYDYDEREGFICISSDPAVAEITGFNGIDWFVTAKSVGSFTITITDPYGVSGSKTLNVVSARENLGTKTFTLEVRTAVQETHSLRGNAYTENTFLYDVPYKVYYTRDGGKTSHLIHEGITPGTAGHYGSEKVTVELPEDSPYSTDAGFYISAETMLDGQRLVTSDLRTDGRAYATLVSIGHKDQFVLEPKLTPPIGEKAKFTAKGTVVYGPGGLSTVGAGFTVQLHLKDGRVVGEAVTDSRGNFSMECEVDAIDNGFDTDLDQYYVTATGVHDGVKMEGTGRRSNGELLLWSLNFMGANPYKPGGMPVTVK